LLGVLLGYGFESLRRAGERKREKNSLRAALIAEAITVRELIKKAKYAQIVKAMALECEKANPGAKVGGLMIHLTENYLTVFEANAGKLGILPADEVKAFVRFHLLTKTLIDSFKPGAPWTSSEHDAANMKEALQYALAGFEELEQVGKDIERLDAVDSATSISNGSQAQLN
jgi:hypothetical protein